MKKNIFLIFLLLLLFCDCSQEQLQEPLCIDTLTADIISTKAEVDGLNIVWSENDKIGVFPYASPENADVFVLTEGAGTPNGSFKGNSYLGKGVAKYPFKAMDLFDGEKINTFMKSSRELRAGVDEESIILASTVDTDGHLTFQNLSSLLKISMTGRFPISRIAVIPASSSVQIAGDVIVGFDDEMHPYCVMNPEQTVDGIQGITLNGSVQLMPYDMTDFYIGLPPQTYPGGLSVTITSPNGSVTKVIDRDLDLKQGGVYSLEPFEFAPTGGVMPSSSLPGHGTEDSPFRISSVEELLCFQIAVNDKAMVPSADDNIGRYAPAAYVELANDLDLSICCGPEIGSWGSILSFRGHFDGCGHKLSNLYINDPTSDCGLFKYLERDSYVGNLEIEGNVECHSGGLLASNIFGTVENIVTRGRVYTRPDGYCGGMAVGACGIALDCRNYADVEGGNCGGVALSISGNLSTSVIAEAIGCVNYGRVHSNREEGEAGGVFGDGSPSINVVNCVNYGDVAAGYQAGGIIGDFFDGTIANCVNYGKVIQTAECSSGSLGGIGGICGCLWTSSDFQGHIYNCINLSDVIGLSNLVGGIAGRNTQTISNCWWLSDEGVGIEAGVGRGKSSCCSSLTAAQFKGQASSGILYKTYTDVVDALNYWAYTNSDATVTLKGWERSKETGWPVLKKTAALPPELGDNYLEINKTQFILNTLEQTIEFNVVSSGKVSLSLPVWISVKTVEGNNSGDGAVNVRFVLNVDQNKSGAERTAGIVVSNPTGGTMTVNVTQRYSAISDDYSRDGNVVTLQKARRGAGIDIVFMGDGYLDTDISSGRYQRDMKKGVEAFFGVEPYCSFRDMFNVYYVELVSQSNSFDGGTSTALDGFFGSGTLVGGDDSKVKANCRLALGRNNLDDVTAIVLLNTYRYSGTCYMYYNRDTDYGLGFAACYFALGTASSGQTSMESVLRHEAGGHGFGKLQDEYAYSSYGHIPSDEVNSIKDMQRYGWFPNVDFTDDPFKVRWTQFIQNDDYESEGVGVFEGAATYWSGIYRPTFDSIMRYNTGQFNAPSRQAIYYKIHKLAYGPSWEYSHADFLEYDKVNLSGTRAAMSDSVQQNMNFVPLHAPVIVRR